MKKYKLNKYLIRYLKDNKLYANFKRKYNIIGIPDSYKTNPIMLYRIVTGNDELGKYLTKENEIEIIKLCEEFLRKKNIEKQYYINKTLFKLLCHDDYNIYIKYNEFINHAFVWGKTKEGWQFWQEINDSWRRTYNNFLNNKLQEKCLK